MSHTHPTGFDGCQDEVEEMMRLGESFVSVEATIDCARITEDERAALWLLAWSIDNRPTHAQDDHATPAGVPVIAD
jgi:hypothetical protein